MLFTINDDAHWGYCALLWLRFAPPNLSVMVILKN